MPASVTHAFSLKIFMMFLPEKIRANLDLDRLKMFGQSTDSLLFYNLYSRKRSKKIRNFQKDFSY